MLESLAKTRTRPLDHDDILSVLSGERPRSRRRIDAPDAAIATRLLGQTAETNATLKALREDMMRERERNMLLERKMVELTAKIEKNSSASVQKLADAAKVMKTVANDNRVADTAAAKAAQTNLRGAEKVSLDLSRYLFRKVVSAQGRNRNTIDRAINAQQQRLRERLKHLDQSIDDTIDAIYAPINEIRAKAVVAKRLAGAAARRIQSYTQQQQKPLPPVRYVQSSPAPTSTRVPNVVRAAPGGGSILETILGSAGGAAAGGALGGLLSKGTAGLGGRALSLLRFGGPIAALVSGVLGGIANAFNAENALNKAEPGLKGRVSAFLGGMVSTLTLGVGDWLSKKVFGYDNVSQVLDGLTDKALSIFTTFNIEMYKFLDRAKNQVLEWFGIQSKSLPTPNIPVPGAGGSPGSSGGGGGGGAPNVGGGSYGGSGATGGVYGAGPQGGIGTGNYGGAGRSRTYGGSSGGGSSSAGTNSGSYGGSSGGGVQGAGPQGGTGSTSDVSGTGPQGGTFPSLAASRSGHLKEMENNPELKDRMMALALSEVGGQNPAAQRAVMETMFNRADAHGQSLDATMNSRYYEPMQNGSYERNLARLKGDPALRASLEARLGEVARGSNDSNLATHNSSAGVAASAHQSQSVTATLSGETFSRKDRMEYSGYHGAGTVAKEQAFVGRMGEQMRRDRQASLEPPGAPDMNSGLGGGTASSQPSAGSTGGINNAFPVSGSQTGMDIANVPSAGGSPRSREFGYGVRDGGGRNHSGLDIPGNVGDPLIGVRSGQVVDRGWMNGYGNYVDFKYDGDGGRIHRYAHMQDHDAKALQPGQTFTPGQTLGNLGISGNASADFPHVHAEVFKNQKAYEEAKGTSGTNGLQHREDPRAWYTAERDRQRALAETTVRSDAQRDARRMMEPKGPAASLPQNGAVTPQGTPGEASGMSPLKQSDVPAYRFKEKPMSFKDRENYEYELQDRERERMEKAQGSALTSEQEGALSVRMYKEMMASPAFQAEEKAFVDKYGLQPYLDKATVRSAPSDAVLQLQNRPVTTTSTPSNYRGMTDYPSPPTSTGIGTKAVPVTVTGPDGKPLLDDARASAMTQPPVGSEMSRFSAGTGIVTRSVQTSGVAPGKNMSIMDYASAQAALNVPTTPFVQGTATPQVESAGGGLDGGSQPPAADIAKDIGQEVAKNSTPAPAQDGGQGSNSPAIGSISTQDEMGVLYGPNHMPDVY